MNKEINAILTIASRDIIKLFRDRMRLIMGLIFPFVFVGILGTSLQENIGKDLQYNFLTFVFIGVLGQTLFQSTASGIISLIEDRENDFAQELFVAPISRFTLLIGKILGETGVAYSQTVGVIIMGLFLGLRFAPSELILILIGGIICSLAGGSFGLMVLANLQSQRSANQLFPFLIFPQFFLAGVFNPIKHLPPILFVLSRIAPMTYAVDFIRGLYYLGKPEAEEVVLHSPLLNVS